MTSTRTLLGLSLAAVLPTIECASAPSGEPAAPAVVATPAAPTTGPPATAKKPVTDTFHGAAVTEDYRWLEDWDDPVVKEWSAAQNKHTRGILDNLPSRDAIRARVAELLGAKTVRWWSLEQRGKRLFAMKRQPPKQQPFLVMMEGTDPGTEKIVLDPNTMDAKGGIAIDWFKPSPNGELVAVSMSRGGTEVGHVTVHETATGKRVHEEVPRTNSGTAGGDLAWAPDGSGFYYTRHPWDGERPKEDHGFYQRVFFHTLGTPAKDDRYELGDASPRIAETQLLMHKRSGRMLATIQRGDGGEFELHLRETDGTWRKFSEFGDRHIQAAFGPKNGLYVLSRAGAPRGRILRVPVSDPDLSKAEVIVEEGEDTITAGFWSSPTVMPTASKLHVVYQLGGPSEIRVFDLRGKPAEAPTQLPVSAVRGLTPLRGDDFLFANGSFTQPFSWYRHRARTGATERTRLVTESPVNMDDIEVVRELATSKDGTKVPVSILMRKGTKLDGSHACITYGYGGYGVNIEPWFSTSRAVLLEQGVIYAIANIRGGGEFGEEWHRQGNLTKKQNVFDDFAAVVGHMVERSYTSRARTGIRGGSNGGLLMGATMVQHPDLARVVVSSVGIYDMLRVELSPNGAFNVTEFGTVKDEAQFRALHAYSPYHHVQDGTAYPATLFLTGANDPRVDPAQSRKMTARLQAANSADTPILLRTSMDSGHGGNTALDERVAQVTDAHAFFLDRLGVKYQPVGK